jgi:hypothetical protein
LFPKIKELHARHAQQNLNVLALTEILHGLRRSGLNARAGNDSHPRVLEQARNSISRGVAEMKVFNRRTEATALPDACAH